MAQIPARTHEPTWPTVVVGWLDRHRVAAFVVMAIAAVTLTLWLGRDLTFFMDDCAFLARDPTDPLSLLEPHNEHWMTVPIVAYLGVVAVFGTSSYLPFLAFLSLVHVFLAAGVLVLLRPALYALAASALILFLGSGYENQFWAVATGFVGGTGLGVWALVATSRGRPALAAALLTVGVACSLTVLAFIPAAAVMIGRRRHVLWLGLPTLTFVAWYLAFGRETIGIHRDPFTLEAVAQAPWFVVGSIHSTVSRMSGFGPTATLVLLVGLGVAAALAALRGWRPDRLAVAGAVGLVVLFGMIALGRAQIAGYAPRYVTTAAPFVLAAVGPLARVRGRLPLALATIVFAVALSSNLLMMREGSAQMAHLMTTELRCEPPL